MAIATYESLCIDAVDPGRLSTFWAPLLGLEVAETDQRLVLRAPDADIGWTVMADPAGNEFCAFLRGDG